MNKGWISINRKLQNHWLWNEKREFSKLEAWLDILLTVNHSEQKTIIKNTLFVIKRGESIKSLDTWAKRWNWNKSKVRRFLKTLESDSMIVTKNEHKTTRLTVCKYDTYQDSRNADETQMKHERNASETQMTPNNNDNNINNDSYTVENFLENWNEARTYKTGEPSHFNKLKQDEGDLFWNALQNYKKDDFHKAIKGLFGQEEIPREIMWFRPKHLLGNMETYIDAYKSKKFNLYV